MEALKSRRATVALRRTRVGWGKAPNSRERKQIRVIPSKTDTLLIIQTKDKEPIFGYFANF